MKVKPTASARILSDIAAGGATRDTVDLGTLGIIRTIVWAHNINGPATFTADFYPYQGSTFGHRCIQPGRIIRILHGGTQQWLGQLDAVATGSPFHLSGTGVAAMASDFAAFDSAGNNPYSTAAVTNAISRGWPVTVNGGLGIGSMGAGAAQSGTITIADALKQMDGGIGAGWHVDGDGVALPVTKPTSPTYYLSSVDSGNPTIAGDSVTAVCVVYQTNATATPPTTAAVIMGPLAPAPSWHIEFLLDVTSRGVITSTTAQAIGTAYLAAYGPQLAWSKPITVTPGMLTGPGGATVDLGTVQTNTIARLSRVTVDRLGLVDPTAPLDLWIGQTSYDADTDILQITPMASARQDLPSLIARAITQNGRYNW